jgi:hypothetical protein
MHMAIISYGVYVLACDFAKLDADLVLESIEAGHVACADHVSVHINISKCRNKHASMSVVYVSCLQTKLCTNYEEQSFSGRPLLPEMLDAI